MNSIRQKDNKKGTPLCVIKKCLKHFVECGGPIVEVFPRQTCTMVLSRKDFADTDSIKEVNSLQKITKSNSSLMTTLGDNKLKSFAQISRITTLYEVCEQKEAIILGPITK